MSSSPSFEELDSDGAIREAAERLDGSTRAGFLKKAGVGAAVIAGGGAFAGALPAFARGAAIPASDIAILNFALTLEYLEAAFYAEAQASSNITGEAKRLAHVVAQHEGAHVKFLMGVLGAKAVAQPKFDFKGTTNDEAKFLATADVLENTGVQAYLGQVPNIKTKAVLIGAGRILPVEARHASWVRDLRFRGGTTSATTPAPGAFESGFTMNQILTAVKGTGFIVG